MRTSTQGRRVQANAAEAKRDTHRNGHGPLRLVGCAAVKVDSVPRRNVLPKPSPQSTAHVQSSVRLFVALWPGPRVRQALAACRDGTQWPAGASPTATDKLHLTLHFIGSVPSGRIAEVAMGLEVPVPVFELPLEVAERWHNGLAVLRPRTVPQPLHQLHADLAKALLQLALPVEIRAFRPHVTLARRCTPSQPVAAEPVRWRVTGYALVQSVVDGTYRLLRRYR
jgi:2'-5' RNA ligase